MVWRGSAVDERELMTDWDKELAKIDKQLAELSDEKLMASSPAPAAPTAAPPAKRGAAPLPPPSVSGRGGRWGVLGRVALAVGLGAALLFWPYGTACGVRLFAYLGALGVLGAASILAAVSGWRHRAPAMHFAALLSLIWALALVAAVVLPRTSYAVPDTGTPAPWLCP
jgi:hypothetical protein